MDRKLNLPVNIRYSIGVFFLLLVLNFVLRVAFLLYHTEQAHAIEWNHLGIALMMGLRYDIATIMLFNGIIFLFLIFPFESHGKKGTYIVLNWLVLLINIPILLMNGVDIVYFGFSEKRLTHELFSTTGGDIFNMPIGDTVQEYWMLFALFFLLVFGLMSLLTRFSNYNMAETSKIPRLPRNKKWVISVVAIAVIFAGFRGGLQPKQLEPSNAFVTPNIFAGNLSLNSAFTMFSCFRTNNRKDSNIVNPSRAIEVVQELISNEFDTEFWSHEFPLFRKAEFEGKEKLHNVVFIVIESFNASNVGAITGLSQSESLTPNFDALSREGLLLTEYHANANRSVEALPSILNSIPDIFNYPLILSREKVTHYGLGQMLQERGYHTSFFHGAKNGSMGFDYYADVSGLDHYYGMDEYPSVAKDFDGMWGIYDAPFMSWWGENLNEFPEPFCTALFTLSNHHPFGLPENCPDRIQNISDSPFKRTTAYTDHALGEFFAKAKKEPWYDRTIFVITADHSNHEHSDPNRTIPEYSHVPLLLIGPAIKAGKDDRPANHLNILPTLIEVMQLDTWHASGGISLLNQAKDPFFLTNQVGIFTLGMNDMAWSSNFHSGIAYHSATTGKWDCEGYIGDPDSEEKVAYEEKLKSLYQVFWNSRKHNAIVPDVDKRSSLP